MWVLHADGEVLVQQTPTKPQASQQGPPHQPLSAAELELLASLQARAAPVPPLRAMPVPPLPAPQPPPPARQPLLPQPAPPIQTVNGLAGSGIPDRQNAPVVDLTGTAAPQHKPRGAAANKAAGKQPTQAAHVPAAQEAAKKRKRTPSARMQASSDGGSSADEHQAEKPIVAAAVVPELRFKWTDTKTLALIRLFYEIRP